eukprot:gene56055-76847_t
MPIHSLVPCSLSQFGSHAHALAVLREMDGSGRYREIAHDGRPIVEFTIENIRKVKILEERKQRSDKRKAAAAEGPRSDAPGPENRAAEDAGPQEKNTTTRAARADSRTKSSKDSRHDKHQQKHKHQRSGDDSDRDRNSSGADKRRKISEEPGTSATPAGSQERKEKAKKLTLRQRELLKQRQRKDAKKQKQQQQQESTAQPLAHD